MKKILLFWVFAILSTSGVLAQLPNGSTAPDWTLTDINGNSHHLYAYLDSGYTVFIDFSATWCGPCWNYHNSGALEDLYNSYGPNGTNEVRVFFIEGDANTNLDCLYGSSGCNSSTQGNWVDGTPYPIINDASQTSVYQVAFWPTIYGICSNHEITLVGQQSTAGLYAFHNSCPALVNLDVTLVNVEDVNCAGESTGSIDISVSGGSGDYSYAWSNGATTEDLQNIPLGLYSVTVSDNGSTGTGTLTNIFVDEGDPINPNQTFYQPVTCAGGGNNGAVGYNPNGGHPGYDFLWSDGSILSTLSGVGPGTYGLTITDNVGCTVSTSVTFDAPEYPTISISPPTPLSCTNSTTVINATASSQGGQYAYQWTTQGGAIISGEHTLTPTVGAAGTYTLTITNNNTGCESSESVSVTMTGATPDISISEPDGVVLTCLQTSLSLIGSSNTPGVTFSWTGPNGFSATIADVTVSMGGTYSLVVVDTENGCTASEEITIIEDTELPDISATFATTNILTCAQPELVILGASSTAGVNFLWTGPQNFSETTATITVDVPGDYVFMVTNPENGCAEYLDLTVLSNTSPPEGVTATASGPITCANPVVGLDGFSATPGVTYSWETPTGTIINVANIDVNEPGSYTLEVTNPTNGCTFSTGIFVEEDITAPNFSVSPDNPILTCENPCVDITASSANNQVTYVWNAPTGVATSEATVVACGVGDYTVVATDGVNGCTGTEVVTVTEADALLIACSVVSDVTVPGGSDGVGSVQVTSGTAPYVAVLGGSSQTISTTGGSATFQGLSTGTYNVLVTDASGCAMDCSFSISAPGCTLALSETHINESCAGALDGSIDITTTGSNGDVLYSWSNGESGEDIDGLGAGTYTVSAVDAAGCQASLTVNLTTTPVTIPTFDDIGPFCESDAPVVLPSSSNEDISGTWNINPFVPSEGTQTVFFTPDDGQCAETVEMMIVVYPLVEPHFQFYGPYCVADSIVNLPTMSLDGVVGYWEPAAIDLSIPGDTVIHFHSDIGQCALDYEQVVAIEICDCPNPPIANAGTVDPVCTGNLSNGIQLNGSIGGGATMGTWSGGNGSFDPDANTLNAVYWPSDEEIWQGGVTLFLQTDDSDGDGPCEAAISDVNIVINPSPNVSIASVPDLCENADPYSLVGSPAGGAFSGDGVVGSQFDPSIAGLGTHVITYFYEDENGCFNSAETVITVEDCGCTNPPTVDAGQNQTVCNGEPVQLSGSFGGSATSATWNGGLGSYNPDNATLNAIYTPTDAEIAAGFVELQLTTNDPDGNGPCTVAESTVVLTFEAEDLSLSQNGGLCCNDSIVTLVADASCDTATYLWNNGMTGQMISVIEPGTYSVTATCSSGCKADASIIIEECIPFINFEVVTTSASGETIADGSAEVVSYVGGMGPYTVEWLFNGTLVGSTDSLGSVLPGTYVVVVTDAKGCQVEKEVNIPFVTGNVEPAWASGLEVYPNPSTGLFYLALHHRMPIDVRVLNSLGEFVYERQGLPFGKIEIDMSGMAPGIYFLKVESKDGYIYRKLTIE